MTRSQLTELVALVKVTLQLGSITSSITSDPLSKRKEDREGAEIKPSLPTLLTVHPLSSS